MTSHRIFDAKLGQTSASLAYACAQEALHKLALEDEEGDEQRG